MSAEVRMVVGSVEKVANAIFFGNNAAKAAHKNSLTKKGLFFTAEKIEIRAFPCVNIFCQKDVAGGGLFL